MPYADPTSESARESQRKAARKHYAANRESEIARCAKRQSEKRESVNANSIVRRSTKTSPQRILLTGAKMRSAKYGTECTITVDDIVVPTHCPVLGIRLSVATGHAKDGSYSLDRIDSTMGYVPGNIQVISHKANTMKSDATLGEIEAVYLYMKALSERGM